MSADLTATMAHYAGEVNSGISTLWIELSTTYTAAESCKTKFRLNGYDLVAFDPGYGLDIDPNVVCAPAAVTTWWEQGRVGRANDQGNSIISLGPMVCPNDWKTVATSVKSKISTLAMCCPP